MAPGFARFWLGETVMFFGQAVRTIALPLTAVVLLEATPTQMGLLVMLQNLPTLFVSLFAGVWIDRRKRRPILVGGTLIRAVLLATIPVLAATGSLRMAHLYVVSAGLATATVVTAIAGRAYLAWLVPPEQLVRANSRLEFSGSSAHLAGQGLGGALVSLVTAHRRSVRRLAREPHRHAPVSVDCGQRRDGRLALDYVLGSGTGTP